MIENIRVLDRTTEIAGPYCTKLFADAGAYVVRAEPPVGDPLRTYRSGALYEFLNRSKRSAQGTLDAQFAASDLVVTSDADEAKRLHRSDPRLVVVCITPFGIDGPWSNRPATEFILQAACGSTGSRGDPEGPPVAAGGRLGEWITGTYAAVAALAAVGMGPVDSRGRLVDVAMLDCMAVTLVTYPSVMASFAGWPDFSGTGRTVEVPSVEPTADGFAVFTTNTAQQFQDFLVMVGREDWLSDESFTGARTRFARRREFLEGVRRHTAQRTTAELLEEAGLFRIPAGPVLNGATVADFEQFRIRGVFERTASGRFRSPRPPYRITVSESPDSAPAERKPERKATARGPNAAPVPGSLPLAGLRVLDCTGWWAGPSATHVLACLGADVVKVESHKRPDPMRTTSIRHPTDANWLEWSAIYHAVNVNKRSITLDLGKADGVELFERLVVDADVVTENYTPRVMEQFGLGWERLHQLNPRLVMVRMPAFGLDGPWRDRTGFAQTMECISGIAWVTGPPDGAPVLVRGACDPLAGMHAAFATLVALRSRWADGHGRLVEATMIESALNATAEQIIEWDVSGELMGRGSWRGRPVPEGVYACAGSDRWVAISVSSDENWESLLSLLQISAPPEWALAEGRRGAVGEIDELLASWCCMREPEAVVEALLDVGVPVAAVVRAQDIVHNPQLRHRGLFEPEDHPITGRHELPTMPFRFSDVDSWLHSPAPVLGRDNAAVLAEVASPDEIHGVLSDVG
jgi:crotonobetainyl-CoA:carnitine CoA-transferase CaiB-like acyl-CoA transferase